MNVNFPVLNLPKNPQSAQTCATLRSILSPFCSKGTQLGCMFCLTTLKMCVLHLHMDLARSTLEATDLWRSKNMDGLLRIWGRHASQKCTNPTKMSFCSFLPNGNTAQDRASSPYRLVWDSRAEEEHGSDLPGMLKALRLQKRQDFHACKRSNFGARRAGTGSSSISYIVHGITYSDLDMIFPVPSHIYAGPMFVACQISRDPAGSLS